MANTTKTRRVALIPGDGIGVEVAASARAVLAALHARDDLGIRIHEFDWSCQRYLDTGALMPPDRLDTLRRYDAVLLGAVGWRRCSLEAASAASRTTPGARVRT
jgi:tartrate dehydrogenase/decarboxylase / D-malate dehydrogenase